jgi:hypothetical protein
MTFDDQVLKAANAGNLIAMLRMKQALASLPPEEAYDQFRSLLPCLRGTVLRHTRASSLQAVARDHARHQFETGPSGVPFVNKAPRVVGTGNQRDLNWRTRRAYVACFQDAIVRAGSAAIDVDGRILFDFEDWEMASVNDRLHLDARVFRSQLDDIFYIQDADRAPDIVLDRAFSLMGPHSDSFGHWIWEFLPKFAAALRTGRLPPLTVVVHDYIEPTQRDAIRQLLPPGSELLEVPFNTSILARELWCAPTLVYMPIFPSFDSDGKFKWDSEASHPGRFRDAIEAMKAPYDRVDGGNAARRKIFLSRHNRARRQMTNWQEIESMAHDLDFQVVVPETLAFADQVATIRSASHIVGPSGSALALCYYARPGTKVCVLSHPQLEGDATFAAVLEEIGVDPVYFVGPFVTKHEEYSWVSDYSIDAVAFEAFLKDWAEIA